ncbi:MAG TPA: DNA-directed RNA polymerase subunit beta' [Candidatus Saccharimonadales bacterium]|nr:DNA-directed RNA polymerase subunit beta' [Candidatus Saccharimonadales bacterium]
MRNYNSRGTNISDFDAVRLAIASPEDILEWSYGEVTKPETINYRTQKPERDGLFDERIFGPVKDINPHDARYKGIRSRDMAVDKRGEIVTRSIVRRERMGHISLASPVAHIWFLRGTPSAIGLLLGVTVKNLERIAYFASYVIKEIDKQKIDKAKADRDAQFKAKEAKIKEKYEKDAAKKNADVHTLAEAQTKELEELAAEAEEFNRQVSVLDKLNLLSETDYRNLPNDLQSAISVGMGGAALKELLDGVELTKLIKSLTKEAEEAKGQRKKKIMKRLRLLESMHRAGIKPSSMCVSVLPVIPPDLRPMVQLTGGRFATSDLNDLYRRVINRNNRLKKLIELNAPEVIRRNEQRMLQEAVDALVDNSSARSGRAVAATGQRRRLKSLSDMLRGKQGRFRQNLLGKRVDYSGRSVIVAGPELKMFQCGLPKTMALELFKPFVIGRLIDQELAHNIRSATRMIESDDAVVWDALDEVIKNKYVLLNRAPSLHRLSIQAFQPVLIEGKAIQLHPLVCKGFNADFDGDQMAVHLPLSGEAQEEAHNIMASNRNLLKPADGSPILHVEQDIVLGCYYITFLKKGSAKDKPEPYSGIDEALIAFDEGQIMLQTPILANFRGQNLETTLGRLLFNEIFPDDFPYQNVPMTSKKLDEVMSLTYQRYGQEETSRIADDLKDLGFKYATFSGLSIGMEDFQDLKELKSIVNEGEKRAAEISKQFGEGFITDDERYRLTIDTWTDVDSKVEKSLAEQFATEENTMSIAVASGARGNLSQMKDSVGMIGIRADATGRAMELPVRSNYKYGLDPLEYFTATRGTRKSLVDIALRTADSGYLTRRLVDVAQDVFTIDEDDDDPGFAILRSDSEAIGTDFGQRLEGRFAAESVKKYVKRGEMISADTAKQIAEDQSVEGVKIMSVLSCTKARGVTRKSYGVDLATGTLVAGDHPVGVIAAQSIGEPGTQLSLDSKHRAGAVTAGDDVTQGLTRVEELLEVRTPKGQAYLSDISGIVNVWEEGDQYIVQVTAKKQKKVDFELNERQARVADGDEVELGDVIAANEDGSEPITAPFTGKVSVQDGTVTLAPTAKSIMRYEIPGFRQLVVADGDLVEAGARLTNGSINLHDLMRLRGIEDTQRYIMNEVLYIFASQGQTIADKHLEVIVRQMFSRVQVEDSGDSEFITGDVVSRWAADEISAELVKQNKKPVKYTQLLLGITKASLSTESFLSAASFQDTTRVLISAATSGRVDNLYGLKENVILGRLIPVGTGAGDDQEAEGVAAKE